MTNQIQESLWKQFGASIDMLLNVLSNCTDNYLLTHKRFYFLTYHTALLLDYYLTVPPKDFSPTLSFTIKKADERPAESIGDMIPDKLYSKQELIDYVKESRLKYKKLIDGLTDEEKLNKRFSEGDKEDDMNYSILEILLYNLRHTQHHVGQLHLLMRQDLDKHMEWAFQVDELNLEN